MIEQERKFLPQEKKIVGAPITSEHAAELEKSLTRLADGLDALAGTNQDSVGILPASLSNQRSLSGEVNETLSGTILPVILPKAPPEISLLIQARLLPDYTFKKFESKSPFGISIFSNLEYTTYRDIGKNIKIYAFSDSYFTILSTFQLPTNVYSVKESNTFFEKTFYLNPAKKDDGIVRFVVQSQ